MKSYLSTNSLALAFGAVLALGACVNPPRSGLMETSEPVAASEAAAEESAPSKQIRASMVGPSTPSPARLQPTSVTAGGALDYAGLAERFLADHGYADATADTLDLHELVQSSFLHVPMGLYDAYFPASLDSDAIEEYQRLCLSLLEVQGAWLEWTEDVATDAYKVRRDVSTLTKWVRSWKPSRIQKGLEDGVLDMLELTRAKSAQLQAAERFAGYMTMGGSLGLAREGGAREPLVLIPDRAEFTRFLAFGGWLYPQHRGIYWQPSIVNWTHFFIDDVKVLATQFAAPGRSPGDYASGISMDARTETGLEQQVSQLALNSMFSNYYGERLPPSLAGAMAVNLVVDVYGECNTRVDGDLRERRTAAREIFVPGGNPNGGILPPNLADSRWRDGHGSDYFQSPLKRALNSKRVQGTQASFQLMDDSERKRVEVLGPFLGTGGSSMALPEDFYGDQLEFFRSYRSCFLNWLRTKGAGSRSDRDFAELLRALVINDDSEAFEGLFLEAYDKPLSSPDKKVKSLESEFLKWLGKSR